MTLGFRDLKIRDQWRRKIGHWLEENGNCDLSEIFSVFNIKTDKTSASSTVIAIGELELPLTEELEEFIGTTDNSVILKTSFEGQSPLDNSLEVERKIYENIVKKLLNNHNTPHLMNYLASYSCNQQHIIFGNKFIGEYDKYLDALPDRDQYVLTKEYFLILEKSNGIELNKWLLRSENGSISEKDLLAIMCQILQVLTVFMREGLRHNDLHFGNIFIEELPKEKTFYYFFEEKGKSRRHIQLKTRWDVKIYDFDRGSIYYPGIPRNLELDVYFCEQYGQCCFPNTKFDLFIFIYNLHNSLQLFGDKIKENIKLKWLTKIINWNWYSKIIINADKYPHLLPIDQNPKNSDLRNPEDCLKMLIEAKWDDAPFIISNDELLKEINDSGYVFYPPPFRANKIWKPISFDTHKVIGNKTFFNYESNEIILKKIKIFTVELADSLMISWNRECDVLKYNHVNKTLELFNLIKNKVIINDLNSGQETLIEVLVCYFITYPMWHKINHIQQETIISNSLGNKMMEWLMTNISNIWNFFNNQLPIEMPMM